MLLLAYMPVRQLAAAGTLGLSGMRRPSILVLFQEIDWLPPLPESYRNANYSTLTFAAEPSKNALHSE
jgi:hypothetical protein